MKTERAAGGIIVRNIRGTWEVLVVQDTNNAWTFPKGKIDTGERSEEAARREIREEVGLTAMTVRTKLPVIRYVFQRDGLISKTVTYFLFESNGNERLVNQMEEGIHNATWMPIDKAIEQIGYAQTNKQLLTKTLWILHLRRTYKK